MKILHLITSLSAGGAEIHLLTLCRRLKKEGYQSHVVFLKDNVKGSESLLPYFGLSGIPTWRLFSEPVISSIPPILHTHLPQADLYGWLVKCRHPRKVWVVTVHGKYANWRGGKIGRWLWRLALRRADAIIVISKDLKEWLIDNGIPPKKIEVIYYGIEINRYYRPVGSTQGA